MARDVKLPNGAIIEGVPDEVPNGVVYGRAIESGLWKPDLAEYGGYPEEQGFGNQFNIGAGKFFADRIPGMDASAPLPDSAAALIGYAAPAVAGAFAVPGSVAAQAAYGGASAMRKGATPTDVLKGAALSGSLTAGFNMAGRVAAGIKGGARSARTIGEALESNPFKRLEAGIQSAGGLDFLARQRQIALNRSVAASFGAQADVISPEVLGQSADEIGLLFEDLVPRSRTFDVSDAKAILDGLEGLGPRVKAVLPQTGTIPGHQFKNLRAALSDRASKVFGSNEALADDILYAVEKMDDSMLKSLGPVSREAYGHARELWKNLKLTESLSTVARDGNVTPGLLAQKLASRAGYGTSYLRDTGKVRPYTQQLFDTVRDLGRLRAPVGDSGTATRIGTMAALGGVAGGLYEGDIEGAVKYGVGAALLPYLAGRATVAVGSRLGPAGPDVIGRAGGALGQILRQRPENEHEIRP